MINRFVSVLVIFLSAVSLSYADSSPTCSSRKAHLVYPPDDSVTITSPVLFAWAPVRNAVGYNVLLSLNRAPHVIIGSTVADREYLVAPLPLGNADWYVETLYTGGCPSTLSEHTQFTVISPPCATPAKTAAAVVRTVTTGELYAVRWRPVPGSSKYRLLESSTPDFAAPTVYDAQAASQVLQHNATAPTPYYYRVQAIADCNPALLGPLSSPVHVVVLPKPPQTHPRPQLVSQTGAKRGISHNVFISGKATGGPTTTYAVTVDKPWISVSPATGPLPATGTVVTVTVDPTSLDAGNHVSAISITTSSSSASTARSSAPNGRVAVTATTPATTIPISISLVTPVNPTAKPGPANSTIVIPAVSHANGVDSQWQSDIRLANPSQVPQTYEITFTPSGTDVSTTEVHQTTIEIDPGDTTAIDDIVNTWYGFGPLNDGVNGALQITPIDAKGNPLTVLPRLVVLASSRTYDVTSNGSLGQYIPAIPISSFVGQSLDPTHPAKLSLQQIAESPDFRTNVGILEASGQPASVLINIFDSAGHVLKSGIPLSLAAGEHRQMNSFLAQQGITTSDGRLEISVISPTGKVNAYASVVDNHTNDPLVVSAVQPTAVSMNRYTVPGVADLNNGALHWRTDLRVFNPLTTTVNATATFYPSTPADTPLVGMSKPISIAPGEVKKLDDVLNATFGITNSGGAVQLTTATATPLVVTARTYDRDTVTNGTYGQFVPGVTAVDAAGTADSGIQLLQIEESDSFRTNVGLAEVTGSPVTVQISAVVPDSRVTPMTQVSLRANEFIQLNQIMKSFGFPTAYNARIFIQAMSGTGKVTAYASVVDNKSSDPTYVPAQ
jgi:hypothetical protein